MDQLMGLRSLPLAVLTRRSLPDSGHSIFEIEQLELDLRGCGEWVAELSRMIRTIVTRLNRRRRMARDLEGIRLASPTVKAPDLCYTVTPIRNCYVAFPLH